MNCIICGGKSYLFLIKRSFKEEYKSIISGFSNFEYHKCENCGFTISKTHLDMNEKTWLKLNYDFHHFIENNKAPINQPPYFEQAFMIKIMHSHNIISLDDAIDFGGGYGTLSCILKDYFDFKINIYDPYIQNKTSSRKPFIIDLCRYKNKNRQKRQRF